MGKEGKYIVALYQSTFPLAQFVQYIIMQQIIVSEVLNLIIFLWIRFIVC